MLVELPGILCVHMCPNTVSNHREQDGVVHKESVAIKAWPCHRPKRIVALHPLRQVRALQADSSSIHAAGSNRFSIATTPPLAKMSVGVKHDFMNSQDCPCTACSDEMAKLPTQLKPSLTIGGRTL